LSALYFNTRKMEKEKLPQEENINGKIVKEFFTSFGPSDKVPAEVSFFYDWFTIYSINYCRSIALLNLSYQNDWDFEDIMNNSKEVSTFTREYAKRVLPEVYKWRNKVD